LIHVRLKTFGRDLSRQVLGIDILVSSAVINRVPHEI